MSAGFDLAGALVSAAISGFFGDKANKRNIAAQRESNQNQVYMMALKRQWELADRRYVQDSFSGFRRFATQDFGEAGPKIDPNSIRPINPYGGTRDGGVAAGTGVSLTGNTPVAGSPNPSGGPGAPGARPMQQTSTPSWRTGP
jgi:hypothetical protein